MNQGLSRVLLSEQATVGSGLRECTFLCFDPFCVQC